VSDYNCEHDDGSDEAFVSNSEAEQTWDEPDFILGDEFAENLQEEPVYEDL
jgi:hypothetical protein